MRFRLKTVHCVTWSVQYLRGKEINWQTWQVFVVNASDATLAIQKSSAEITLNRVPHPDPAAGPNWTRGEFKLVSVTPEDSINKTHAEVLIIGEAMK